MEPVMEVHLFIVQKNQTRSNTRRFAWHCAYTQVYIYKYIHIPMSMSMIRERGTSLRLIKSNTVPNDTKQEHSIR